ncbi:hypothetical protein HDU88_004455 [Geranomyces variabilis]|nr:hypothetical protein HDU88_004455 [Geranomyces variabilis]
MTRTHGGYKAAEKDHHLSRMGDKGRVPKKHGAGKFNWGEADTPIVDGLVEQKLCDNFATLADEADAEIDKVAAGEQKRTEQHSVQVVDAEEFEKEKGVDVETAKEIARDHPQVSAANMLCPHLEESTGRAPRVMQQNDLDKHEFRAYGSQPVSKVGSRSGSATNRRKVASAGKARGNSASKRAYLPILRAELFNLKLKPQDDYRYPPAPQLHSRDPGVALPTLASKIPSDRDQPSSTAGAGHVQGGPPRLRTAAWTLAHGVELEEVLKTALSEGSDLHRDRARPARTGSGYRAAARRFGAAGVSSRNTSRPSSAKKPNAGLDITVVGNIPPVSQRPPSATVYRTAFSPPPEQSTYISASPARPRSSGRFSFHDLLPSAETPQQQPASLRDPLAEASTAAQTADSPFMYKTTDHDMKFHLQEANTFLTGQKTRISGGPDPVVQSDANSDRRRAKRGSLAFAPLPVEVSDQPPAPSVGAEPDPAPLSDKVEIVHCVEVASPIPPEPDHSSQAEPAVESVPEPPVEVIHSLPASIRQSMDRLEEPQALESPPPAAVTLPELSPQANLVAIDDSPSLYDEYDEPLPVKWDWNIKERDLVRAHGCIATSVLEKYVNAVHSQTTLARELGANRISVYRVRSEAHLGRIAREERAMNVSRGTLLHLYTVPGTAGAARRCEAGDSCWKSQLYAEKEEDSRRRVLVR